MGIFHRSAFADSANTVGTVGPHFAARGDAMTPAQRRRRVIDADAETVDAKPLPQILRDWAKHHVELFVRDVDSDEHSIVSDFDGNALSVAARRAVHEEAQRQGVRARSEHDARDSGVKIVTLRRGADATDATCRGEEEYVADGADADDEAFVRWTEECGYEDMRDEPFDLYAELKISKENTNPAGRARAAYHREAMKWHPDHLLANGGSAGFCDACQSVLRFSRWHRANERGERGRDFCAHCVATSKRSIAGREWDRKHNTAPLVVDGESAGSDVLGRFSVRARDVRVSYREWAHESSDGVSKAAALGHRVFGVQGPRPLRDISRSRLCRASEIGAARRGRRV